MRTWIIGQIFRGIIALWLMVIITYIIYVSMDHEFLINATGHSTTIILGFIGILSTVLGFLESHLKIYKVFKKPNESDSS